MVAVYTSNEVDLGSNEGEVVEDRFLAGAHPPPLPRPGGLFNRPAAELAELAS